MPRERTLAPGFFTNHLLANCPPLTRLFFQGIWTLADFDGCFAWDPEGLAMKLLPRDDFDPQAALVRLERDGFIKSFEADGRRFGYITKWHDHQDPHPMEKPVCPRPSDDPNFRVRVKAEKYRRDGDIGFGISDLPPGSYPFQQVASKLLAGSQKGASNAMPSCPSLKDIKDMKDMEVLPPSGMEKERATPDEINPEITQLHSAYQAIAIPGSPWPTISPEDLEAIPGISRCLSLPGWLEQAVELLRLMPDQEASPFLAGLVPPKSGGRQFNPTTIARYLFSDPRRVPEHLKRIREALARRQSITREPKGTPPAPNPARETWAEKKARVLAEIGNTNIANQETR